MTRGWLLSNRRHVLEGTSGDIGRCPATPGGQAGDTQTQRHLKGRDTCESHSGVPPPQAQVLGGEKSKLPGGIFQI